MKFVPWSYSRLNAYETCPKKYFHVNVQKSAREKPNEKTDYGTMVHQAFATYLTKGTMLPLSLRHHQKMLEALRAQPGEHVVEQKAALNNQFAPTGYFDEDVWVRVISDLTILQKRRALTIDWKTGKMSEDFTQLRLVGAVLFQLAPELDVVRMSYVWTQNRQITSRQMDRAAAMETWREFLPRVKRYQAAHEATDFPARQNPFCKYCPVTSCPYNDANR